MSHVRLNDLLLECGRALNANNGRCAVIEKCLCDVTSLCTDLLSDDWTQAAAEHIHDSLDDIEREASEAATLAQDNDAGFHVYVQRIQAIIRQQHCEANGGDRAAIRGLNEGSGATSAGCLPTVHDGPEVSGNNIADEIEAERQDWRIGLSAKPKYRQHEMYYEPPAMIVAVHGSGFGGVFCSDGVLVLEGRYGVRFLAPAEEWVTA